MGILTGRSWHVTHPWVAMFCFFLVVYFLQLVVYCACLKSSCLFLLSCRQAACLLCFWFLLLWKVVIHVIPFVSLQGYSWTAGSLCSKLLSLFISWNFFCFFFPSSSTLHILRFLIHFEMALWWVRDMALIPSFCRGTSSLWTLCWIDCLLPTLFWHLYVAINVWVSSWAFSLLPLTAHVLLCSNM